MASILRRGGAVWTAVSLCLYEWYQQIVPSSIAENLASIPGMTVFCIVIMNHCVSPVPRCGVFLGVGLKVEPQPL